MDGDTQQQGSDGVDQSPLEVFAPSVLPEMLGECNDLASWLRKLPDALSVQFAEEHDERKCAVAVLLDGLVRLFPSLQPWFVLGCLPCLV